MKKYKIIALADLIITVICFIIGLAVLPEEVPVQFSLGGSVTTAPRLVALGIPTLIGAVSSVVCFLGNAEISRKKLYIVMAIGLLLFPVMFICSALMTG